MSGRWRQKAEALARLAEDQAGTPEGRLAEEMLAKILRNHPEASSRPPSRSHVRTRQPARGRRATWDERNREFARFYNEIVGGAFEFTEGFFEDEG